MSGNTETRGESAMTEHRKEEPLSRDGCVAGTAEKAEVTAVGSSTIDTKLHIIVAALVSIGGLIHHDPTQYQRSLLLLAARALVGLALHASNKKSNACSSSGDGSNHNNSSEQSEYSDPNRQLRIIALLATMSLPPIALRRHAYRQIQKDNDHTNNRSVESTELLALGLRAEGERLAQLLQAHNRINSKDLSQSIAKTNAGSSICKDTLISPGAVCSSGPWQQLLLKQRQHDDTATGQLKEWGHPELSYSSNCCYGEVVVPSTSIKGVEIMLDHITRFTKATRKGRPSTMDCNRESTGTDQQTQPQYARSSKDAFCSKLTASDALSWRTSDDINKLSALHTSPTHTRRISGKHRAQRDPLFVLQDIVDVASARAIEVGVDLAIVLPSQCGKNCTDKGIALFLAPGSTSKENIVSYGEWCLDSNTTQPASHVILDVLCILLEHYLTPGDHILLSLQFTEEDPNGTATANVYIICQRPRGQRRMRTASSGTKPTADVSTGTYDFLGNTSAAPRRQARRWDLIEFEAPQLTSKLLYPGIIEFESRHNLADHNSASFARIPGGSSQCDRISIRFTLPRALSRATHTERPRNTMSVPLFEANSRLILEAPLDFSPKIIEFRSMLRGLRIIIRIHWESDSRNSKPKSIVSPPKSSDATKVFEKKRPRTRQSLHLPSIDDMNRSLAAADTVSFMDMVEDYLSSNVGCQVDRLSAGFHIRMPTTPGPYKHPVAQKPPAYILIDDDMELLRSEFEHLRGTLMFTSLSKSQRNSPLDGHSLPHDEMMSETLGQRRRGFFTATLAIVVFVPVSRVAEYKLFVQNLASVQHPLPPPFVCIVTKPVSEVKLLDCLRSAWNIHRFERHSAVHGSGSRQPQQHSTGPGFHGTHVFSPDVSFSGGVFTDKEQNTNSAVLMGDTRIIDTNAHSSVSSFSSGSQNTSNDRSTASTPISTGSDTFYRNLRTISSSQNQSEPAPFESESARETRRYDSEKMTSPLVPDYINSVRISGMDTIRGSDLSMSNSDTGVISKPIQSIDTGLDKEQLAISQNRPGHLDGLRLIEGLGVEISGEPHKDETAEKNSLNVDITDGLLQDQSLGNPDSSKDPTKYTPDTITSPLIQVDLLVDIALESINTARKSGSIAETAISPISTSEKSTSFPNNPETGIRKQNHSQDTSDSHPTCNPDPPDNTICKESTSAVPSKDSSSHTPVPPAAPIEKDQPLVSSPVVYVSTGTRTLSLNSSGSSKNSDFNSEQTRTKAEADAEAEAAAKKSEEHTDSERGSSFSTKAKMRIREKMVAFNRAKMKARSKINNFVESASGGQLSRSASRETLSAATLHSEHNSRTDITDEDQHSVKKGDSSEGHAPVLRPLSTSEPLPPVPEQDASPLKSDEEQTESKTLGQTANEACDKKAERADAAGHCEENNSISEDGKKELTDNKPTNKDPTKPEGGDTPKESQNQNSPKQPGIPRRASISIAESNEGAGADKQPKEKSRARKSKLLARLQQASRLAAKASSAGNAAEPDKAAVAAGTSSSTTTTTSNPKTKAALRRGASGENLAFKDRSRAAGRHSIEGKSTASGPHRNPSMFIAPPIRVLLVEDNSINRMIMLQFLKQLNVSYDAASNGAEALSMWKKAAEEDRPTGGDFSKGGSGPYHIVFMDIQMPVMDGISATKEIRRLEKEKSIGISAYNGSVASIATIGSAETKSVVREGFPALLSNTQSGQMSAPIRRTRWEPFRDGKLSNEPRNARYLYAHGFMRAIPVLPSTPPSRESLKQRRTKTSQRYYGGNTETVVSSSSSNNNNNNSNNGSAHNHKHKESIASADNAKSAQDTHISSNSAADDRNPGQNTTAVAVSSSLSTHHEDGMVVSPTQVDKSALSQIAMFPEIVKKGDGNLAIHPTNQIINDMRKSVLKQSIEPLHSSLTTIRSPVIIVALTASSLERDRRTALAAGCNDFLTKPVSLIWLKKKVMEWGCMQALIDHDRWRRWRSAQDQPETI